MWSHCLVFFAREINLGALNHKFHTKVTIYKQQGSLIELQGGRKTHQYRN